MTIEKQTKRKENEIIGGELYIIFDQEPDVKTVYHEIYDPINKRSTIKEELQDPKDGKFIVETGDTVAFVLDYGGRKRAVSIHNYRERPCHQPGAVVCDVELTKDGMEENKLAELSAENDVAIIDGVATVFWVEN